MSLAKPAMAVNKVRASAAILDFVFIVICFKVGLYLDSHADVSHGSLHGAPDECGLEVVAPWVVCSDDGMLLPIVGEILASDVKRHMAELAGDLCR